jgi:primosomal protein N' (replication factor Y)
MPPLTRRAPRPEIEAHRRAAFRTLPPLSANWRQLVTFAAGYYQRSLGEVALAALPPQLRELDAGQLARGCAGPTRCRRPAGEGPPLTPEQARRWPRSKPSPGPFVLFGATGSGKTEVYLRAVRPCSNASPQRRRWCWCRRSTSRRSCRRASSSASARRRWCPAQRHDAPQRLRSWLAAHAGQARIVLGTRMAIFASLPQLRLIVVDEEHDPSYKQQEGARYSARDLAVYRGRLEGAKVVLGSATPSLESWQACDRGRYRGWRCPAAVGAGALPRVRLVDMNHQPKNTLFAAAAGRDPRAHRPRRAVAGVPEPARLCARAGLRRLRLAQRLPALQRLPRLPQDRPHAALPPLRLHRARAARLPACGNVDIAPLGRGTERLEEQLAELLADARRPDGQLARIARMDADSTRQRARWRNSWRRCTRARSTCWSARRW